MAGGLVLTQAQAALAQQPPTAQSAIVAISHRGEHLHHPENTIPAFLRAIDAGADFFEADIRTTSDGKLVIMHDSTVNRTTEAQGPVKDLSFAQIESLDAGGRFSAEFKGTKAPTFDQVLKLAHGKINVYVDTKDADPQALVDAIEQNDMQDHVVIYGNAFFLYDVHKIRPELKIMPEADSLDICRFLVHNLHPRVIAFGAEDFKPEIIACAKEGGAKVYVDRMGDTDNPAGWQQAIDMGADGIQTDKPAELVEYLRAHHLWVAAW
jgi:glycerophosphoryl diester phosphodiesterase